MRPALPPAAIVKGNNHFIPQAYLRRWADADSRLWVYSMLVSDGRVPTWRQRSVRSVAVHRHLYSAVRDGSESDAFERWLDADFEAPAAPVIAKVEHGEPLNGADWERLAFFMASLDVRTPSHFLESMRRWHEEIPHMLRTTVDRAVSPLERGELPPSIAAVVTAAGVETPEAHELDLPLPLRVQTERIPGAGGLLKAEMTIGRRLWLHSMRQLLTKTARALLRLEWTILRPAAGWLLPTSDHPVLRLNFTNDDAYDFGGGWGRSGCDVLMPLTPRHLMYARVGHPPPPDPVMTPELTLRVQRLLVARAHREIYHVYPRQALEWFRPRVVNREQYDLERRLWDEWPASQAAAEVDQ